MKRKYHIQPGDKFGRLTAISLSHIGNHNRSYFNFKCDCGNEKIILGSGVVSGNTKSCGCLSKEVKLSKRLPNDRGVVNHLILQYKRHAKGRGFTFNLSYKTFNELIRQNCHYCGCEPSNVKVTKNHTGFTYSGIDRMNPKYGYSKQNCVSCCNRCNRAKGTMTKEEFVSWIKAMAAQWG